MRQVFGAGETMVTGKIRNPVLDGQPDRNGSASFGIVRGARTNRRRLLAEPKGLRTFLLVG
jgi:hypothetical protein